MKSLTVFALLLASAAHAADVPATADCAKADLPLLLGELPADVQALLGRGAAGIGGLADRDEAFNATDAVKPGNAPMTRFRWAGQGDDCLAVTLERGGFLHYFETVVLRRVGNGWRIAGTRAPRDGEMGMREQPAVATAAQ